MKKKFKKEKVMVDLFELLDAIPHNKLTSLMTQSVLRRCDEGEFDTASDVAIALFKRLLGDDPSDEQQLEIIEELEIRHTVVGATVAKDYLSSFSTWEELERPPHLRPISIIINALTNHKENSGKKWEMFIDDAIMSAAEVVKIKREIVKNRDIKKTKL